MDTTGDDSPRKCPVLQQELAVYRRQGDTCRDLDRNYSSSRVHTPRWPGQILFMRCSNHVVGCQSTTRVEDRAYSLMDLSDNDEYADAVRRRKEGVSPSAFGNHPVNQ